MTMATFIGQLLLDGVFVLLAWVCLRRRGLTLAEVGLRIPNALLAAKCLLLGLIICAVAVVVSQSLNAGLSRLLTPGAWKSLQRLSDQTSAERLFLSYSLGGRIAFAFLGIIAAPFSEEILFRGWIYNALNVRIGKRAALIGSSLLFALAHLDLLGLPVLFGIGLVLGYVYTRTESLWASILVHAANNALAFGLLVWLPRLAGG